MLQTNKDGLILYCIVYAVFIPLVHFKHGTDKVKIQEKFDYVHAENASHARMIFHMGISYSRLQALGRRCEIISVAPAIGWHAIDDNGDQMWG